MNEIAKNIAKTFLQRLKDIYSQNALRYLNKDENAIFTKNKRYL